MIREGDRLCTYSIPELPLALDVSVLVHRSRPASYIILTIMEYILDDGLKLCIVVTQQQSHRGCVQIHANHCPASFTTIAAALCRLCASLTIKTVF